MVMQVTRSLWIVGACLLVIVATSWSHRVHAYQMTLENTVSDQSTCITSCEASCSCPIGPNGLICSNHGVCVNQSTCTCDDGWIARDPSGINACDTEIFELNGGAYMFVMILNALAIFISIGTSTLYYLHRHTDIMLYFRPTFGHLMNFGVILGCSTLMAGAHLKDNSNLCIAIWWLIDYSFVFVFGTLMAKTYRNFRILRSTRNESLRLSDGWVMRLVALLLAIESVLLLVLVLTNKLIADDKEKKVWEQDDGTYKQFQGCYIESRLAIICVLPTKVFTIVASFLLGYELRKVKTEFNETNAIFISSGFTLFVWLLMLILYLFTDNHFGDFFYIALTLCICFPFVTINVSLCIPKLHAIHRGSLQAITSIIRKSTLSHPTDSHARYAASPRISVFAGIDGQIDMNEYLKHVNWSDVGQVEQAENYLLSDHASSPVQLFEPEHHIILLLLSKKVRHRGIRRYGAMALDRLDNKDLKLFLPQLIQALRYEPQLLEQIEQKKRHDVLFKIQTPSHHQKERDENYDENGLHGQHGLHGGVAIDIENEGSVPVILQEVANATDPNFEGGQAVHERSIHVPSSKHRDHSMLADVLIARACKDIVVATTLYWYLKTEMLSEETIVQVTEGVPCLVRREKETNDLYQLFFDLFMQELRGQSDGRIILDILDGQNELVEKVRATYQYVCRMGSDVKSKVAHLRNLLADNKSEEFLTNPFSRPTVHLLHPNIYINGTTVEKCFIFRSSAKPMKLAFTIDEQAQRLQLQNVIHSSIKMKRLRASSLASSRSLSVEFEGESSLWFEVVLRIRGVRGLKNQYSGDDSSSTDVPKARLSLRTECGGKMNMLELNSSLDEKNEMDSQTLYARTEWQLGRQPNEVEIHLYRTTAVEGGEKKTIDSLIGETQIPIPVSSRERSSITSNITGQNITTNTSNHVCLQGWYLLELDGESRGEVEVELDIQVHDREEQKALNLKSGLSRVLDQSINTILQSANTSVIYKEGDDLRQDQLAIQLIRLMDTILKQSGLNLYITTYEVLVTTPNTGFLEFVPHSFPLSVVLEENHHSILEFLRCHNFSMNEEANISAEAMDIYLRSCAGYCAITYILGVGDRHLDNLMLKTTGHFFHIDFGFLFGRDPKPFPPPFRLTPEMVAAMGGIHGQNFYRFVEYAMDAFNILRASADTILSLLHMMEKAGITDMKDNPMKAISEVEERLVLHASSDKAAQFMRGMILHSQSSKTKTRLTIMEQFHKFAVSIQ